MVKASTEIAYNGVEMPPEAFLVLEGSAVSSSTIAMPGLAPQMMMQAMMSGGMGMCMQPGMGMVIVFVEACFLLFCFVFAAYKLLLIIDFIRAWAFSLEWSISSA